jgi:hypothetical protein
MEINISIAILIFIILLLYYISLYKLLTTTKYHHLYKDDKDKYIIYFNLLISYIQIGFFVYFLTKYKKEIVDKVKNNNIFSFILIIIFIIFLIYFICILHLTYILMNMDRYNQKKFYILTNWYILIQFILFVIFIVFLQYTYKSITLVQKI